MAELDKLFGPIQDAPKNNSNAFLIIGVGMLLGGIYIGYQIKASTVGLNLIRPTKVDC